MNIAVLSQRLLARIVELPQGRCQAVFWLVLYEHLNLLEEH